MRLYTEVLIESEEQAEALPEGSVAMHEDHWPFQKFQGVWQSEDRTYSSADLIGWTTYALIEAEEEESKLYDVYGPNGYHDVRERVRFLTEWVDPS